MRHLGRTPPFRGPDGEVVSGSIAEIAYRRLGGLDQWVMIRGESVDKPPLILLHGGPGLSETSLFRRFNAPLEKSFTVVYWDQRGAGKSFDRNIPRSTMTVEQFISDLDELVDAVCRRLGKTKVAIFGHSWGSALGVLYAAPSLKRLRPTSAVDSTAMPLLARRLRTRSRLPRRSVAATAGR
jgi:pimeloyl-ACP methyl ester carboxylesterase